MPHCVSVARTKLSSWVWKLQVLLPVFGDKLVMVYVGKTWANIVYMLDLDLKDQ